MKSALLAIILSIVVVTPFVFIAFHQKGSVLSKQNFAIGSTKIVKAYKPHNNKLALILDDGSHIFVYLSEKPVKNFFQINQILQESEPPAPTITFRKKHKDGWLVDFHLTINKKRYNMLDIVE